MARMSESQEHLGVTFHQLASETVSEFNELARTQV